MTATSAILPTPVGPVRLHATPRGLCRLELGCRATAPDEGEAAPLPPVSPFLARAASQLHEYFAGLRPDFDCPLDLRGTPFQLRVWEALREVPYGSTISYSELARRLALPRAARAVARALRANPVPILIPCHRVVAADGSLGGFSAGPAIKRRLLAMEKGVDHWPRA